MMLLVLSSLIAVPVSAANITLTVEKDNVQTRMVLSVYQNMTAFPKQIATVTKSDVSFNSFSEAIRVLNPSVTLSDLTINLSSATNWLNLSITMTVPGVAERHGDVSSLNMSWKAFNVPADLQTGNLTYNQIGKRYFRPVYVYYANASRFVSRPNATITGVSFFVNDTQAVSATTATNSAGNATILDFRPLSLTVDRWTRTYNLSNNTTTWRYNPSPLIANSIKIQQGNNTKQLVSRYNYNAEVIVSGLARANGDMLQVDVGGGVREWVMAGIVVLAIVAAVAVHILFRSRKKKLAKMGRR
jgi:hypothetical protein